MAQGRFIVFEGLDGAGTSTQVYRLRDFLLDKKIPAEVMREPTNGPLGGVIRLAIEGRVSLHPTALALAFAADRADHIFNSHSGIMQALKDNRWVISDRYVLSSLAYQGAEIEDIDWLIQLNRFVITPDLTIFIDTPVEICDQRLAIRSSHFELFHSKDKLLKVSANFAKVMFREKLTGKVIVADGTKHPQDVFESFLPAIQDLILD